VLVSVTARLRSGTFKAKSCRQFWNSRWCRNMASSSNFLPSHRSLLTAIIRWWLRAIREVSWISFEQSNFLIPLMVHVMIRFWIFKIVRWSNRSLTSLVQLTNANFLILWKKCWVQWQTMVRSAFTMLIPNNLLDNLASILAMWKGWASVHLTNCLCVQSVWIVKSFFMISTISWLSKKLWRHSRLNASTLVLMVIPSQWAHPWTVKTSSA